MLELLNQTAPLKFNAHNILKENKNTKEERTIENSDINSHWSYEGFDASPKLGSDEGWSLCKLPSLYSCLLSLSLIYALLNAF